MLAGEEGARKRAPPRRYLRSTPKGNFKISSIPSSWTIDSTSMITESWRFSTTTPRSNGGVEMDYGFQEILLKLLYTAARSETTTSHRRRRRCGDDGELDLGTNLGTLEGNKLGFTPRWY
jgi:hypothetical protein